MGTSTKVTQRSIAVAIFGALIPQLAILGAKEFRSQVRGEIMEQTGVDDASASAMYNHAKNRAVGQGEVEQFGRSTKTGLGVPRKVVTRKDGENWAVVNKTTGAVVGYTTTRKLATDQRGDGETVKKADAVAV